MEDLKIQLNTQGKLDTEKVLALKSIESNKLLYLGKQIVSGMNYTMVLEVLKNGAKNGRIFECIKVYKPLGLGSLELT